MFTTLGSFFFCCQKKQKRSKWTIATPMQENRASGTSSVHSSVPVIRRDDMISFVLPIPNCSKTFSAPAAPKSSLTADLGHAFLQVPNKTTPLLPLGSPRSASCPSLNLKELNLQFYSPGQETNDHVHSGRSKIGVSLQYDPLKQHLVLKVLGALNLPRRNKEVPPDPYIKVAILPDKVLRYSTKTLRSNCHPLFNESFVFFINEAQLKESQLCLKVCDRSFVERSGLRSATLGYTVISLADLLRTDCRRQVRWCLLEKPSTNSTSPMLDGKGSMLISLCYEPEQRRMQLELMQLRERPLVAQEKDKVMLKVLLYENGVQIAARRTKSFRGDDVMNGIREKFIFSLQPNSVHEASCQIILFTRSKIGTKTMIGRIYLGHRHFFSGSVNCQALASGIDHWHDMAYRPDVAIERWHSFN